MNMRRLLVVSLGVLMTGTLAWGAEFPWEVKLPFKEATIHYQLSGMEQGEEVLYIKDYGRMLASYHTASTSMMGMTTKSETVEITTPDWVSTYDLVEQTASKTTNPNKLYQREYNKLSRSEKKNFKKNATSLGAGMSAQMGGDVTQTKGSFLGYDCDVVTVKGMSTSYVLEGTDIPLKTVVSMMGMKSTVEATTVDTSSPVPDSVFEPPVGLTAEYDPQAEAALEGTVQQMVNSFKEPDGGATMQQQSGMGAMTTPRMDAMQADGVSADEQAEMMRRMQEAMKNMQQ
ncbi:hypothetical protein JWJ90_12195 [Desulfobulbus rhabdoformis]|uniref:hypothetical protein n=1 Tax=Desulfobulbus rhabdoformis TaxID=34032 RepID=UPI001964795A|nr:hypothetical protein [Desulfobulbus rhabdoformis]MBM9615039.1 hypothetical protein [Desulfobulbus rhabdoformis]